MSVEITVLPSGLRVVTDTMAHVETASLGVWVAAGSRHEAHDEHGLSHLLEHMAFKGTRRRSAHAIAEEIESAGGDLNAATGVEQTAYYAHVLAADTGLALDILSDILTDSTFDRDELEREKGVILQEIGAVEDTPDDLVFDLFNATAFPGQPLGRAILGTPEGVSGFDRDSIGNYLNSHYLGGTMVVGATSAVEHDSIVEDVAKRFAGIAGAPAQPVLAQARYAGGERRLKRRLEQAHIVVGFEGCSYQSPDHYAFQVFANAVGGGMSSRLFQEVREKRGLAYSIYAFNWAYSDTGLLGFYAATGARDVAGLMPVALDCLAAATQDLSEAEVRRAKAQMKVSLLAALESPGARSEQIARQLLAFGRVLSREEMIAQVETLSLADIRAAGAKALASPPSVASIGPVAKVMTPDRIRDRLGGFGGS
ncbi:MAG: pitrilysin family protein [Beijerinckiaceae bacterium]|jgi:predicted Zn-dependent peptidase